MENFSVLLTCPISTYLQEQLSSRFNLLRLWKIASSSRVSFLTQNSESIRAMVVSGVHGANAAMIDLLPNLEVIASHSSGLDQIDLDKCRERGIDLDKCRERGIDLDKCRERGIRVTYAPGAQTDEVADMAILLAMATIRRLREADRFVRSGSWRKTNFKLTTKFSGKSVGIIGLGRIGSAIAKRAEAFGCPISYYSRSKKQVSGYDYYPDVVGLASNCEILIVACALTDETRHIVNREVIDALGATGVIVNIARGAVVDEPELVSALVDGRLAGAGLDVLENEPEVPEQLIELDNVVLSPHAGAYTVEARETLADVVIENLEAHFQNKPLLTPVPM